MASSREYNLTVEAIGHAIGSLDPFIGHTARRLWQQGGCQALGAWADVVGLMTVLDAHDKEMMLTLRDLCIALNTMITEDTSK
jgi:hypothetical protein